MDAVIKGSDEVIEAKHLSKRYVSFAALDDVTMENLELERRLLGNPDRSICEEMLALVGLSQAGKKKVKHFSMGMKHRLGIAVALLGRPQVLVLDEPVNGLDPKGITEVRELLKN